MCWYSSLTFRITKVTVTASSLPPNQRKQTNKNTENKLSAKKMFGWQTTSPASPGPHAHLITTEHHQSPLSFGSSSGLMWTHTVQGREWDHEEDGVALGVSWCLGNDTKKHKFLHSLTSSEEGASVYVFAVLTRVAHQHGISGERQHKNHINVIPQRELAAQSLSATQVFCP